MNKNSKKFKETDIGFIPEEWKIALLGKCSLLLGGKRLPKGDSLVEYKTHHPYIRITDFLEYGVDEKKIKFITPEVHNKIKKYIINEGDIYISNVGTIGLVGVIKGKMSGANLTENAVRITKFNGVNNYFLYYYLKSTIGQEQIKQNTVGAVQPKLPIYGISNIKIILPDILEQERIAEILSSLDDKIELNRKINSNLEKIASLLFKQWFVDIGNDLPRGWKIKPLQEVFDFLEGPGIRNWQYSETGTRFINIRLINQGDIDVMSANYINQKDVDEKYQHFLLKKDDLVLSASGTLGRSAIVRKNHLPLLLNTSVIRFRPQDGISYPFMYQYLQSKAFLKEQVSLSSGSVQVNFGPTHLKQMSIVVPDDETLARFNKICESFYKLILFNLDQNNLLQRIRDSLLPRLMSGKIRVNKKYE